METLQIAHLPSSPPKHTVISEGTRRVFGGVGTSVGFPLPSPTRNFCLPLALYFNGIIPGWGVRREEGALSHNIHFKCEVGGRGEGREEE